MISDIMKSLDTALKVLLSGETYIIHLIPIYKHKVDICVNGIRVQEDLDGFCYQYAEIIVAAFEMLKIEYKIYEIKYYSNIDFIK
jgi:hypothetical protein